MFLLYSKSIRIMTETEALVILTEFNRWRRDNDDVVEMPPPALIGQAIDVAIDALRKVLKVKAHLREERSSSNPEGFSCIFCEFNERVLSKQRDINQSEFGFVENEDLLKIFELD